MTTIYILKMTRLASNDEHTFDLILGVFTSKSSCVEALYNYCHAIRADINEERNGVKYGEGDKAWFSIAECYDGEFVPYFDRFTFE